MIPYPIKKEIDFGDRKVLLLDVPIGVIYNNNVLCIDKKEQILWQITPLASFPGGVTDCPFVDIQIQKGNLILFNFCSFNFIVDPLTGKVIERKETR